MAIYAIGINYQSASLTLREQLYFPYDKLSLYLEHLLSRGIVDEAVLLSTCNRTELYCIANNLQPIREWFFTQAKSHVHELGKVLYVLHEQEAVEHILKVACGLDSMIFLETQIFGQMKEAFSESCSVGAVTNLFQRLFQQVFAIAKEIRTATTIGACPVSLASAALRFAKEQGLQFSKSHVLLIGAGETIELMLQHVMKQSFHAVTLINRDKEKAERLATKFGCQYESLQQLPSLLTTVDLVFTATGSPIPFLTEEMMKDALHLRKNRSLLLVDLAVPRDVEPTVSRLSPVKLYCLDDLRNIIEKNLKGREHATQKAIEMIKVKSAEFIRQYHTHAKVNHTIRAYRLQIEAISHQEMKKAKQQLRLGIDPQMVLDRFVHDFTQKLLHVPSIQLRQAGIEGREELLQLARQLFDLKEIEKSFL